jgi:catechol 2,3-dioxygenase-like lactoylglutathione lyase family enzyme
VFSGRSSIKSMLDHVSLAVSDLRRSSSFYDVVLGALGVVRVWTKERAVGYGLPGGEDRLALFAKEAVTPSRGSHLAFTARAESQVRAFHDAAMAAGGTDDGPPGPRPGYGPGYMAAFVKDPDGHRLESVFHGAAGEGLES